MRNRKEARATLDLLATGLATRGGCIHLVGPDGTEATFDPFEGGRAEFASLLLRTFLGLPDGADVRAAIIEHQHELAVAEDCESTTWEVHLFVLGMQALTPRYTEAKDLPVGLTVTTGSDAETPAYEFACHVLQRFFGEG